LKLPAYAMVMKMLCNTKFTRGPWFVRYCDDDKFQCMTVISSNDYGPSNRSQFDNESDTVAIVLHQLGPAVSHELDDFGDANAKLIAAAPELLISLKELVKLRKIDLSSETDFLCDLPSQNADIILSTAIRLLERLGVE